MNFNNLDNLLDLNNYNYNYQSTFIFPSIKELLKEENQELLELPIIQEIPIITLTEFKTISFNKLNTTPITQANEKERSTEEEKNIIHKKDNLNYDYHKTTFLLSINKSNKLLEIFKYFKIDKLNKNLFNLFNKAKFVLDLKKLEYYNILYFSKTFSILLDYFLCSMDISLDIVKEFKNKEKNNKIKLYINFSIFKNQDTWKHHLDLNNKNLELKSLYTIQLTSFQRRLNLAGFLVDKKEEIIYNHKYRIYEFVKNFER
jgi:hypothetical protein